MAQSHSPKLWTKSSTHTAISENIAIDNTPTWLSHKEDELKMFWKFMKTGLKKFLVEYRRQTEDAARQTEKAAR